MREVRRKEQRNGHDPRVWQVRSHTRLVVLESGFWKHSESVWIQSSARLFRNTSRSTQTMQLDQRRGLQYHRPVVQQQPYIENHTSNYCGSVSSVLRRGQVSGFNRCWDQWDQCDFATPQHGQHALTQEVTSIAPKLFAPHNPLRKHSDHLVNVNGSHVNVFGGDIQIQGLIHNKTMSNKKHVFNRVVRELHFIVSNIPTTKTLWAPHKAQGLSKIGGWLIKPSNLQNEAPKPHRTSRQPSKRGVSIIQTKGLTYYLQGSVPGAGLAWNLAFWRQTLSSLGGRRVSVCIGSSLCWNG